MENNQNIESTAPDFPNRDKVKSDAVEVMDKAKTAGREQLKSESRPQRAKPRKSQM